MPFNKYVILIYFILLLNINLFKKKKINTSTIVGNCFMVYDKNNKLNKIEYIKQKNILEKEKYVFKNFLLRTNIYKKKKNISKLLYKTNSKVKTTSCQQNNKNRKCYSYLINNRHINNIIECLHKVLNNSNHKLVSKGFKKNNVKIYMKNSNINDSDIMNLLKLNGKEKNMDNSNICKSVNNKNEEGDNELLSHKTNDMINNLNDDHIKIMKPLDITQFKFFKDGNSKKKEKIIIIIGVTCSGKTKFSIDLSEQLMKYKIKSEIISADSMQVYQNFNVGVAKVEEEEMRDVKHHLLDVCHPNDTFNAHKYINYTMPLIKNMNGNNKIPIIAGGTLLYIESLLWESVIDIRKEEEKNEQTNNEQIDKREDEYLDEQLQSNNNIKCNSEKNDDIVELDKYVNKTNEELYEELKNIDEERANQLHKNDRKRVCRSLDIFYTYNKKHSDLIKIKNHKNNNIDKMRFFPCIFYLDYNDDELLKMKIKNRVELMISNGLLDEAIKLKQINNDRNLSFLTKGINQSIAYKEFDEYIKKKMDNIDDPKLFEKCKDSLIRRTYKYAKKQRRWISNRFVKVYNVELNKIDVSSDYEKQLNNAIGIVLKFLKCQ
ncbi:tRNA delta(2)-isopentenylpyrophosphate transferase, putative [Plasmodium sp. DRC-Itaito]|uniref:tRNA dimethylallyltransferase n=1 Tax=Plasmodium gaboni TaxID=647221 RepID=A0ABY1UR05_9APIC|nr:tRNA delta(2)-isopentenylpyrophosphate transferase, putative [Plasmodium gaboni]SOV23624.1 tRNA delta(2)-isopentenylpyrophosphate transferase, putative [Plasmodium sp. DRC-Itaito]